MLFKRAAKPDPAAVAIRKKGVHMDYRMLHRRVRHHINSPCQDDFRKTLLPDLPSPVSLADQVAPPVSPPPALKAKLLARIQFEAQSDMWGPTALPVVDSDPLTRVPGRSGT